jgi:hypothetical protein
MSRGALLNTICELIGKPPVAVKRSDNGWPGIVNVTLPSGEICPVALHVSKVSSHSRKQYELRFQNPGDRKPVQAPNGTSPILAGLYASNDKPILVAVDGKDRVGRNARFSILFKEAAVKEAATRGWAVYTSSTGENIYAMNPAMFPVFVEMIMHDLADNSGISTSHELADAVIAAGLMDDDSAPTRQRARRAADILVRHHAFGRAVVDLYKGQCAMCGLDYGLVVGAHIYPVPAPGSEDKVWNGIALCHNHHAAFDAHKIWVNPKSRNVLLHPGLKAEVRKNNALKVFIESTYDQLAKPTQPAAIPKQKMFEKRYEYFDGRYNWVL